MDSPQYKRSRELLEELHNRGFFGDDALAGSCWYEHPLDQPEPGKPSRRKAFELELTPAAAADPEKVALARQVAEAWDFGPGKRVKVTVLAGPPAGPTRILNP